MEDAIIGKPTNIKATKSYLVASDSQQSQTRHAATAHRLTHSAITGRISQSVNQSLQDLSSSNELEAEKDDVDIQQVY
ncbi:MAG: hypothetical protein U0Z75_02935 [Deinococcaceae bacterium]